MKIINFGSLNIDRVYSVEHFVRPGETLTSSDYNVFAGGKGLNQSIALARAGAEVFHAGKVGADGYFLKQILAEDGVDDSLVTITDGPTGHAVIQVASSGENSIILFGGANQEITDDDICMTLADAAPGDWLLLQNEINATAEILSMATELGLNVMFNPAPMTSQVLDLPIHLVKWLIVNEVEGEMLSERKKPEEMIDTIVAKYPEISLILTLGDQGVYYGHKTDRVYMPAKEVTPVDTTGAGDTFVGYFLAETVKGTKINDCLKIATRAAALCVTREGASASIPKRNELC
jgi:ribokinase